MLSYIVRRLLLLPPTLIGITAVVFFTVALSPGGLGGSLINSEGSMRPAERAQRIKYLNERYGLDKPYLTQYLRWLNRVSPVGFKNKSDGTVDFAQPAFKLPDLGDSFTRNRKVSGIIAERLPVSILFQVVSLPITYAIAILSGIYAAQHRGKFTDVSLGTIQIALFSVPVIWVGTLFIGFLCNKDYLHLFPVNDLHDMQADGMAFLPKFSGGFQRGWLLDSVWHMVLPVICLSYGGSAVISKLTRGALLDTLGLDFIRTARAKGLSERVILFRHAFRNSLLPLITVAASILPALVGGAIIIETIFGIEGMGKLTIDAIESRDRELFLSTTLVISFLTLIGYLLADIGYAAADPRVSYDQ